MILVVVAGSLEGFKWTCGLSKSLSISLFSLLALVYYTMSKTQTRWTHLTFPPSPFPLSLWHNTTRILWDTLPHFVSVIVVNLFTTSVVNKLQGKTEGPLIFRSSVSDLIMVNTPQCGERNSMFSLLIEISRTFPCDIRGTESPFN